MNTYTLINVRLNMLRDIFIRWNIKTNLLDNANMRIKSEFIDRDASVHSR